MLVVGGGIFGACAAWDATLRGLRVALVEKADFCSGVSANSYKMVHGGIRYMQHMDVPRVRSSCFERSALLRIAPHLVEPLPTLIPTYGHTRKGKFVLGAGMYLYDLLTLDRNIGIADPERRIPWSRFMSRGELLRLFPGIPGAGLTGAAVFSDAQMYNPTRLVWSFLQSAAAGGAFVSNYCRAVRLDLEGRKVRGCVVRDELSGEEFTVKTKSVLNAAGPWAEETFAAETGRGPRRGVYSRDAYFVIRRRFPGPYAIAIPGESADADALFGRGARHMFMVPWRDYTLVGVWHLVYDKSADEVTLPAQQLDSYIGEINRIYPGLDLTTRDVLTWNAGLVPFGEQQEAQSGLSFGKRSLLIDHEAEDGIAGLLSVIGIRYTMGRGDAQRAVEALCRRLGRATRRPQTDRIPLVGGAFRNFEALVARVRAAAGGRADEHVVRALAHTYGTRFERVLRVAEETGRVFEPLGNHTTVSDAELRYVARHEQVHTLADAVLRRTDLATGGDPGGDVFARAATIVGEELGWSEAARAEQLTNLQRSLPEITQL
jgi:glycerol-3-phosphate dehydrogenase